MPAPAVMVSETEETEAGEVTLTPKVSLRGGLFRF